MAISPLNTIKTTSDALDWFERVVRSSVSARKALFKAENNQRGATVVGKMFFFKYDPKTKATLPVYDIYPLVFPIEMYSDGMLCLNLHYLTVSERTEFLKRLAKFATTAGITERTRLKLSYDLISTTSRLASMSRPCVKRYLYSHVRSTFIEIPGNEWDRAAALPTEQFVYKK